VARAGLAGTNAARCQGQEPLQLPPTTMLGALNRTSSPQLELGKFQPMPPTSSDAGLPQRSVTSAPATGPNTAESLLEGLSPLQTAPSRNLDHRHQEASVTGLQQATTPSRLRRPSCQLKAKQALKSDEPRVKSLF